MADATLTASGIAKLAGVGRAAVSNWRRRYADFPAPVGGTPTSPYFNAQEVDQWLRRQGKMQRDSTRHWAWRHIETYQPAAHIGQALAIAGAYLLVRSEQSTRGDALLTPKQLRTGLRAISRDVAERVGTVLPDEWGPHLTTILHAVDLLAAEEDPEAAFEFLHSQYVSSAHTMSGLAGTPDIVAEVMTTLAGTGPRMLDFTCGTGSILRMAAQRALDAGTVTHCHAQEISSQYALITLIRLWFVHLRAQRAGHPAAPAPTVCVGDSLLADGFRDLRVETVVANFPFGIHEWGHAQLVYDPRWVYGLPPRTEPELAWVQHGLAHLVPGGTAVVLMPPAAASRPAGRRVRAELIRQGALRAVIALPAGLMPPAGIGLHVWVLTRPESDQPSESRILLLDATDSNPPGELIATVWHQFLSDDYAESPGVHRAVAPVGLLDNQVDLTPQRHLSSAHHQPADPDITIARVRQLQDLLAKVTSTVPAVRPTVSEAHRSIPRAKLADLVRAGSMSVRRATGDETSSFADPGDIILAIAASELRTSVVPDDDKHPLVKPGDHIVTVDPTVFDPWFVAATISGADTVRTAGRASSATGAGARLDLRRLTVPVLSLPEQRGYGEAFRALMTFEADLAAVSEVGAAIVRDIRSGLTSGTLAPPV